MINKMQESEMVLSSFESYGKPNVVPKVEPMSEREAQVGVGMYILDKELGELSAVICSLEGRLVNVLVKCSIEEAGPKPDRNRLVPLAEEIEGICERVRAMRKAVCGIYARCEL